MVARKPKPIMLSHVKRLVVNDGDTIVLTLKSKLSPEQYNEIKSHFGSLWKDRNIKTIILTDGMDIGVLAIK